MAGTPLDDLPEGTLLYKESSVRSVSEAIRSLTGKNDKYTHLEQANAIRNLRKIIYPFFTLGKGSGGMGINRQWGSVEGGFMLGPIFPNLLYNFRETKKHLNIVFKVSPAETGDAIGTFDARLKVGGYWFYVEYQSNVPKIRIDTVGSYDYNPNDECKIHVDTEQKKISMYINDILIVENITVDPDEFTKRNEEDRNYIDFGFPAYGANPGTTAGHWHTCEIKYFRMEMEDW